MKATLRNNNNNKNNSVQHLRILQYFFSSLLFFLSFHLTNSFVVVQQRSKHSIISLPKNIQQQPVTTTRRKRTTVLNLGADDDATVDDVVDSNNDDADDADDDNSSSFDDNYSSYLATCIPGLAHILADELETFHSEHQQDIVNIQVSRNAAVTFQATRPASLYALAWLRTAHRLLELIASSSNVVNTKGRQRHDDDELLLYDRGDLYEFVCREVQMKDVMGNGVGGLLTLSVHTILNQASSLPKDLCHSHYTSLTIKNAICDSVRDVHPEKVRPTVDTEDPDVPLVAILLGKPDARNRMDAASISLYRCLHSPGSLHKRGYRSNASIHKAAMKESMAAGLLYEAGWHTKVQAMKKQDDDDENNQNHVRFIDPMAGSGSLVLEGLMMAMDIAPGLMRIRCNTDNTNAHKLPPVTRWKSEDTTISTKDQWKHILINATQRAKLGSSWMQSQTNNKLLSIHANDIYAPALTLFRDSIAEAGFSNLLPSIQITNSDCQDLELPPTTTSMDNFVVVNPPWGVRLMEQDMITSWEGLKHFVRDTLAEENDDSRTELWVLSGNKMAPSALRLKRNRMIPLQTGSIHLRWIQYTIRRRRPRKEKEENSSSYPQQKQVPIEK